MKQMNYVSWKFAAVLLHRLLIGVMFIVTSRQSNLPRPPSWFSLLSWTLQMFFRACHSVRQTVLGKSFKRGPTDESRGTCQLCRCIWLCFPRLQVLPTFLQGHVDGHQCTFDVTRCGIGCILGYESDEYACAISCNCATRGLFEADISFSDVSIDLLLTVSA